MEPTARRLAGALVLASLAAAPSACNKDRTATPARGAGTTTPQPGTTPQPAPPQPGATNAPTTNAPTANTPTTNAPSGTPTATNTPQLPNLPGLPNLNGDGGLQGALNQLGQLAIQHGRTALGQLQTMLNQGRRAGDGGTDSIATRAANTTPLTPTPVAQTVAGRTITAQFCRIEGPDILGTSMSSTLESIELAPDGSLYAVDGEHAIRRYRVAAGNECRLTPDTTFGTNGVLRMERDVRQVSVDSRGRFVASTGVFGSWRVNNGRAEYYCERPQHGSVALAADGNTGFGWFVGNPIRRITYGDAACTVADWTYENPFRSVHTVHVEGQRVYVGGSMPTPDNRGQNQVAVYDLNGREQARFGGANATADDGLCWVHSVHPCAAGVCVLDTNCRAIHLWSAQGQHVGNVRAGDLLGLSSFWLNDLEVAPRNRVAYIAAAAPRDRGSDIYQGLIYRVTGL